MLHNKYFHILKQFLGDYTKEIHGRGLLDKVALSQKAIALTLEELEEQSILKSRKQGNMKYYSLNTENTEIKDILVITELTNKVNFLLKHRDLAHIFREDQRIVGIFGSYAKGVQKKESDVDLFIIGNNKQDYKQEGKTFDLDISTKKFTKKEFTLLLKQRNPLIAEILQHHVLLFNSENFINLIWRYYYGFN